MKLDDDQIKQILGAEIQGKSVHPASIKTLFGIRSSVEVAMDSIAREVATSGEKLPEDDAKTAQMRARLIQQAQELGEAAVAGRADRWFIFIARRKGYDIPAYPFDPKGEFSDFLYDEGARDLPAWYAGQGFEEQGMQKLSSYAVVGARDASGVWQAVFTRGVRFVDASRIVALSSCEYLKRCSTAELEQVARLLGF